MGDEESNEVSKAPDKQIYLSIEKDDFDSFVSSVLGKPQTITGTHIGPYELRRDDIVTFYHLVDQRVKQQNEAWLAQFTVQIIFDDDTTVLLNSLEDFEAYAAVKAVSTVGANLTWTYMVKFQDKDAPEKQMIEVSFAATGIQNTRKTESDAFIHLMLSLVEGSANFRIEHTARTWGSDIEALLSGHIKSLIKDPPTLRKFIQNHSYKLGLLFGILLFTGSVVCGVLVTDQIVESLHAQLGKMLADASNVDHLEKKLDFVAQMLVEGLWPRFAYYLTIFLFLSFLFALVCAFLVGSKANIKYPSFVILSRKASEKCSEAHDKIKNRWHILYVCVVVGFIVNMFGNLIFYYIINSWR